MGHPQPPEENERRWVLSPCGPWQGKAVWDGTGDGDVEGERQGREGTCLLHQPHK